jgi:hypothetical protein
VKRVLAHLFESGVGKDVVSRVWRKVKGDWDLWNARSLADEPIVRLILTAVGKARGRCAGKFTEQMRANFRPQNRLMGWTAPYGNIVADWSR